MSTKSKNTNLKNRLKRKQTSVNTQMVSASANKTRRPLTASTSTSSTHNTDGPDVVQLIDFSELPAKFVMKAQQTQDTLDFVVSQLSSRSECNNSEHPPVNTQMDSASANKTRRPLTASTSTSSTHNIDGPVVQLTDFSKLPDKFVMKAQQTQDTLDFVVSQLSSRSECNNSEHPPVNTQMDSASANKTRRPLTASTSTSSTHNIDGPVVQLTDFSKLPDKFVMKAQQTQDTLDFVVSQLSSRSECNNSEHPPVNTQMDSASANKTRRPLTASTSTSSTHNIDGPVVQLTDFSELPDKFVMKAQQLGTLNFMASQSSSRSECNNSVIPDNSQFMLSTPTTSTSNTSSVRTVRQPKLHESISDIISYEQGEYQTQAITDALIYMLAKDNMPLSTTENPGFVIFMRNAVPMYKIPSINNITNLVKIKYEALSYLIKSKLSLVENITLTTDIWTDTINRKSFLGMTAHFLDLPKLSLENVTIGVLELSDGHTSKNISNWFDDLLVQWRITKKQVVTVVTDNGTNIMSAVRTTFGQEKHFLCFGHTLNLVGQISLFGLPNVQKIVSRIKYIMVFFKHSVTASDKLKKLCNLKLKQFVPTHWNSILFMINRFIICSKYIASVLINIREAPTMLSSNEMCIAKEILIVLKPLVVATRELRGENYIIASKVLPLINCLIKQIENVQVFSVTGLRLKSTVFNNLRTRFCIMKELNMLTIATILDPRFKQIHLNAVTSSKAIQEIERKIVDFKNNSGETSSNKSSIGDDTDVAKSIWSTHNELVTKKAASNNSEQTNERMPTDLQHYLNQPTIPLDSDILKFWDTNRNMYPHLRKVVEPYLSFVATSVPSKQLFSMVGNTMTKKRNRLKGDKLQQLLFLGSLKFSDWHT